MCFENTFQPHSIDMTVLSLLQLLVSGGVDSTVCAALLRHALKPDQVIAVHIDNGN